MPKSTKLKNRQNRSMGQIRRRAFPKLNVKEFKIFKKLDSPSRVQDLLDTLRINFEKGGETCRSPLMVLRTGEAHCMEGAMLAAAIFWYHGRQPLLMDLATTNDDDGHALALFKDGKRWGAVTKTNHAVLRYRDAVYASPQELAMSYFNEYFLDGGKKTMREYSAPFDLSRLDPAWLTAEEDVWALDRAFLDSRHFKVTKPKAGLRRASNIEKRAGKLVEWGKDGRRIIRP